MSKALYRKYRSKTLNDVIGQGHVTQILSQAITSGRISHAYLLTGPRGVGKTSVARIMAHEINNLPYDEDNVSLDIIEIDAASNNGVEDIRNLRDKVQIAPVAASKKVYIIDEVHMLSKAAFNALLKTLEEPPEHVVFILATTNVEKIPATILSRTQRFSFRPINVNDAAAHLRYISDQEQIKITDDALELIARRGDGSFRDSISLLDQLASLIDTDSGHEITKTAIEQTLGLASSQIIDQLITAVEKRDLKSLTTLLDDAFDNGTDINILTLQLTNNLRERIVDKPQLLPLLNNLIDVTGSPLPQLKLLSVLGMAAMPKQSPKTVALATPVLEVTASIQELTNIDDRPEPPTPPSASKRPLESKAAKTPKPSPGAPESTKPAVTPVAKTKKKPTKAAPTDFDWPKLIEYTRQNHIALFSVLSKCSHELNGEDLTIYAMNKFYKKKLDDSKYSALISECLQEIGCDGLNIETIPTAQPPSDSQAAAVAALMGGGQEVKVEGF